MYIKLHFAGNLLKISALHDERTCARARTHTHTHSLSLSLSLVSTCTYACRHTHTLYVTHKYSYERILNDYQLALLCCTV
jgi:hypothetical protein